MNSRCKSSLVHSVTLCTLRKTRGLCARAQLSLFFCKTNVLMHKEVGAIDIGGARALLLAREQGDDDSEGDDEPRRGRVA